jgi:hypothetical protein
MCPEKPNMRGAHEEKRQSPLRLPSATYPCGGVAAVDGVERVVARQVTGSRKREITCQRVVQICALVGDHE